MKATGSESGLSPPRLTESGRGRTESGGAGAADDGVHGRLEQAGADLTATRRILVVDDDDDFREIVVEILTMAGWKTSQATSGQEALEMVLRECPDLIVLDQRMPGLSGDEVVRRLRARNQSLPIVLVTAAKNVAQIARSLDLRFYLQKPVGLAQLKAMIQEALADGAACSE